MADVEGVSEGMEDLAINDAALSPNGQGRIVTINYLCSHLHLRDLHNNRYDEGFGLFTSYFHVRAS